MPRTFFGFLPRLLPSTTPPTRPAAAVATPVTTAAFAVPFKPELALRALPPDDRAEDPDDRAEDPDDRAEEPRLPEPELPLRDDAELPLRDEAADERRLDALAVFGLLREAEDLLLLFDERVFAWAIVPP
jgi:hypothetical protein